MARAVIFDLDGTLVSFNFDVRGSRKALLEELASRGFEVSGYDLTLPTQEILDGARRQIAAGEVQEDYKTVRNALYLILDAFEVEGSLKSVPFRDTRETLNELKRRKVRLAVVTNSGRTATMGLLGRSGMIDYFEFVLTRDDVEYLKPNPDGLLRAVSRLSLPAPSILFVGDSVLDILAAKRAGLKVVSVATGNYSAERLKAEGADIVLPRISDLPEVIGQGKNLSLG